MDQEYSTKSNFLEIVDIDQFYENKAIQNGNDTNGKQQSERTKSEKIEVGYMKQIKQTLVLRKKYFWISKIQENFS